MALGELIYKEEKLHVEIVEQSFYDSLDLFESCMMAVAHHEKALVLICVALIVHRGI